MYGKKKTNNEDESKQGKVKLVIHKTIAQII